METARIRKGVLDAIARAKRDAGERRARTDAASRAFDTFLNTIAVPMIRQIGSALRAEGYLFTVFTPSGSGRLMSDKGAEDFIDISLDAARDPARVTGRVSRSRGRRVIDAEHVIASGDPAQINEEELFEFLTGALEPFVER